MHFSSNYSGSKAETYADNQSQIQRTRRNSLPFVIPGMLVHLAESQQRRRVAQEEKVSSARGLNPIQVLQVLGALHVHHLRGRVISVLGKGLVSGRQNK